MPPHRKAQIESTLQRAISQVLARQLSDPRIGGLLSVTRVTVSPDRHDASVFVSVLPQRLQNRTLAGLRHASGHIKSLLCKAVAMRAVPRLNFQLDDGLKKQAAVFDEIARAVAADENHATPSSGDP